MKPPKPHPSLPHADLQRLVSYNPATGVFIWLTSPSFNVKPGDVAGSLNGAGYRYIKICGVSVRASRLAWFYVHGTWPVAEVDHKNQDRGDDRIENLREATRSQNNQNRTAARRDSGTGLMGVSQRGSRWRAAIFVDGRIKHLGTHDTAEAAHAVYLAAKRRLHAGLV